MAEGSEQAAGRAVRVGRWFDASGQGRAHTKSFLTPSGRVDHQGRTRVTTNLDRVIEIAHLSRQVNVITTDAHAQGMITTVRGHETGRQDRPVGQVESKAMR